jgi:O-antigen biosynthesis protein
MDSKLTKPDRNKEYKLNDKVSIIIPTYNGSKTLPQTLDSVLQQEYKNYEIIVVDDGSTDSTLEVVKSWMPKARIIEQKNRGTMAARQAGIDASSGDLIAFLDQDDIWFMETLLVEVDFLQKHPEVQLVVGNMRAVDESGIDLGFDVIPNPKSYTLSWENLLLIQPIATSTTLFRKDVVEKIGGLDANFGYSGALGDLDMFIRISDVTKISFINRNLGLYRWSETRPGRLISFLDNLQIYTKKYWRHPRLVKKNNFELRSKFVQACCNYALHIYRLLLNQYDGKVPRELFLRLNMHNKEMQDLFEDLYIDNIGLKSIDLDNSGVNTDENSINLLLFIYLLRLDLQKMFPKVINGELGELLDWGANVAAGRYEDQDARLLSKFVHELTKHAKTLDPGEIWFKRIKYFRVKPRIKGIIQSLLPIGSKRRRLFDLARYAGKILVSEGWRSLGRRIRYYAGWESLGRRTHYYIDPPLKYSFLLLKKLVQALIFYFNLKFAFPHFEDPLVAVVVVAGEKGFETFKCLYGILTYSESPYQVIVLRHETSKVSKHYLKNLRNLTIINYFGTIPGQVEIFQMIRSHLIKEKYVLFLKDDSIVNGEYLKPMTQLMDVDNKCGAVSCKKVDLSQNSLFGAGGILWKDGSCSIYGQGDDSERPEYSFVRSVHFDTGNFFLVRTDILEKLSSEYQSPSTDIHFCNLIRDHGYEIKYQPSSVVTISENAWFHSDAEIASLAKLNKRSVLEHLTERNIGLGEKILVIDDYIPAIRYGSGFPRLYEMLIALAELGYKVTFFPVGNPVKVQPETGELQQKGVEVFWGEYTNIEQFACERSGHYDVVLVSRPHVFKRMIPIIQQYFPDAAILYDAEALFYTREILKAEITGSEMNNEESLKLARDEMQLIESADMVIAVSLNTKTLMRENSSQKNIEVWEHVQEVHDSRVDFKNREGLLFFGSFFAGSGSPNEDAVLYFTREIFPEIHKILGCKLYVVGTNPTQSIKDLASINIEVMGYVEDPGKYFNNCRVNVVPTRFAAGIPLKLLQAMSYGTPSVVSKLMADQLNLLDNNQVIIANNASEFSEKIVRLYSDEELWETINKNSLSFVKDNLSKSRMKGKLKDIITKGLKIRKKRYIPSDKGANSLDV